MRTQMDKLMELMQSIGMRTDKLEGVEQGKEGGTEDTPSTPTGTSAAVINNAPGLPNASVYPTPGTANWPTYNTPGGVGSAEKKGGGTAPGDSRNNDRMSGLPGRQAKFISEQMPDFLGKLDKVSQIVIFEDQLACTIDTVAAGELGYLISIGGRSHRKENLHTTVRMSPSAAESVKQARLEMPIQDGASSMYVVDQQRFFAIITLMLGPNVRDRLRADSGLGKPTDPDCGSDLFSRMYAELVPKGPTARKGREEEAQKAISCPLTSNGWPTRKLAIVDRMAVHEAIGEPLSAEDILYWLQQAMYTSSAALFTQLAPVISSKFDKHILDSPLDFKTIKTSTAGDNTLSALFKMINQQVKIHYKHNPSAKERTIGAAAIIPNNEEEDYCEAELA